MSAGERPRQTESRRDRRGSRRMALRVARLRRSQTRLAVLRLLLFALIPGLPLLCLYGPGATLFAHLLAEGASPGLAVATALVPAIAFAFVLRSFARLQALLTAARGQAANYADDTRRLAPEWWRHLPGTDVPAAIAEAPEPHPYADDLSLFGRFSIFQFMDRTVTPVGREQLAKQLYSQPDAIALDPERYGARRDAIALLSRQRVFRQSWRRRGRPLAESYGQIFAPEWLRQIARLPRASMPMLLRVVGFILPAITIATYIGFEMQWNRAYYLLTLPIQVLIFFGLHFRHRELARTHGPIADQLSGFEALFRTAASLGPRLTAGQSSNDSSDRSRLRTDHLTQLSVLAPDARPAREVRVLSALSGYFSFRRNPLLHGLAGIFCLYEIHVVHALAQWQARSQADFSRWFADLAELDALQAWAGLGDTEAHTAMPESLLESHRRTQDADEMTLAPTGELALSAGGLGHPLIGAEERVTNDLEIIQSRKLWLITGSNMSGKSTFLRTIGTALVFAMVGAPVCAQNLRFRPLRLYTSMNQRDDLSQSLSLFYAEVKRIKFLQDAQGGTEPEALFLIDEMLRGTNARERLIASKGIVEGLRASPAFALIATHDMDLIQQTRDYPDLTCYHFQEIIDANAAPGNQAMRFDYRLKDGPVTSSNALKILEMEGVRL